MRARLLSVALLIALAACKKEAAEAPIEESGAPQIATSIDDYALPVDRSGQVTSIDAATGDSSGMPRDGGAVLKQPKAEAEPRPAADTNEAAPAAAPPPLVVPPPPPAATAVTPAGGQ